MFRATMCPSSGETTVFMRHFFFFFFFFFFYWLYNTGWVLVCSTILFHTCLSSVFTLQPVIFILLRPSSTWSIHINLGLPTGLVLFGFHSVIFLVVLVFSILITWANHLSLCDFINFIIILLFHPPSQLIICFNSPCFIWIFMRHIVTRNMKRLINILRNKRTKKNCAPSWLYLQHYTGMLGQQNIKFVYVSVLNNPKWGISAIFNCLVFCFAKTGRN